MRLSAAEVAHVARLARLELSAEDEERFAGQLSAILEHVETMRRLDTSGVEPLSHPADLRNVLRRDAPRPCLDREDALAAAPAAEGGRFAVPRVLGEEP